MLNLFALTWGLLSPAPKQLPPTADVESPSPPAPASAGDLAETGLGRPAPAFFLPTLNPGPAGTTVFSTKGVVGPDAPSGGRPLVLSFIASYCEPCQREAPALAAVLARHPAVAAAFIVLDRDDAGREAIRRRLVDDLALPVPLVADRFQLVARRYGAAELPYLVLVSADGNVRWVSRGLHVDTLAQLEALLPPGVP